MLEFVKIIFYIDRGDHVMSVLESIVKFITFIDFYLLNITNLLGQAINIKAKLPPAKISPPSEGRMTVNKFLVIDYFN